MRAIIDIYIGCTGMIVLNIGLTYTIQLGLMETMDNFYATVLVGRYIGKWLFFSPIFFNLWNHNGQLG